MKTTYGPTYRTRDGGWFASEWGEDGGYALIHLDSKADTSAGEPTPYNADCNSCWLGHAHSGDKHRASLASAKRTDTRTCIGCGRVGTGAEIGVDGSCGKCLSGHA